MPLGSTKKGVTFVYQKLLFFIQAAGLADHRSVTSIGATANKAVYELSRADFIAKLQFSLKETAETEYWLRLLILRI
ncbi:MAG: four helix bundle protein [Ruminococcaceae bacterium]|nr:four helix bundle protein [Oscillospiraceae bacterium]